MGTWKKISSVYGKNIQNNCLKRNPSNTHNWRDEVNNINDLVLNYLGWSKKEDKNISHGHIIVYPYLLFYHKTHQKTYQKILILMILNTQ